MALNVTWCSSKDGDSPTAVRFGTSEEVAVAASVNQSAAAPAGTTFARLYAAEAVRVKVGDDPQPGAADGTYMPAGHIEYVEIAKGEKVGTYDPT